MYLTKLKYPPRSRDEIRQIPEIAYKNITFLNRMKNNVNIMWPTSQSYLCVSFIFIIKLYLK